MGVQLLVLGFTVACAIAMVGLVYIFREFELNRRAVVLGNGKNGHAVAVEVAWMLVQSVSAFVVTNGILLAVGIGSLFGVRWVGWLLILLPAVKLGVCYVILRSLRRQARLAGR